MTVKRIFDEFLGGMSPETIAKNLNHEKVPGCMGEAKWAVTTIPRKRRYRMQEWKRV